ncbi:MAG: S1C family serine protease [Candidatus Moranbacteria bacterium]|nr:S1C family serine protease [Candidatus Moranbacteria bacterium]
MNENNKSEKDHKSRKGLRIIRFAFFVLLVFALSGASLVIIDYSLIPRLTTAKWLNKYKFLQKATKNVVVVNKTEQVTVSEEQNISRYSNKSASSVVEIISQKSASGVSSKKSNQSGQTKFGSGLIATADGLIITYQEAILADPAKYKIITSDGTSFEGRVVLTDSFTGLTFIKVDGAENLPTASFIAPEDIKTGSKIIAIGRGESNASIVYKSGLISQLAEQYSLSGPLATSEKLQGVFLTDMAFDNLGDENLVGAAAADYNGDVVGILGSQKVDQTRQYFIISVNHIEHLIDEYLANGAIKRGSLGVYYLSLDKENSYLTGNKYDRGALVYSPSLQQGLAVISGSPADKAGLRISDVILSVNGEEVNPGQNLAYLVSKYKPGDELNITVARDGQEMEIKVTLQ